MIKSEYHKAPITQEQARAEGDSDEEDLELFMIVRAFTEGSAHALGGTRPVQRNLSPGNVAPSDVSFRSRQRHIQDG